MVLALLVVFALITWTVTEKQGSTRPRGFLKFTIVAGNLTLTATSVEYGCTDLSGGASSGELSIRYAYVLSNLGDSGAAVTVLLRVGNSTVAEHAYHLVPHQVVHDTIGMTMTYEGNCQALAAGLGLSVSYPG